MQGVETATAEAQTLRERKKAATADALHRAAMELAIERGLTEVTVEAIVDAAEVSRRTFSNYFANKEDALLHGERERLNRFLLALHNRPTSEPAWQAIRLSTRALFDAEGEPDPEWVAQSRLVRRHPSLTGQQLARHAAFEEDVAADLARRVGDPLRARLMAAAFTASLRVGTDIWLERRGEGSLSDQIDQMLATMGERFD
ncbi:TetR family transcriptional regulator [Asanoa ishikariensis]|uniref:Transcriptional regulator, TetR family n=1 Tax=Asanoa ishikariensis TaxID=137265 RepID=A0A1H3TA32_9ACTN|nr:TetR family transcriptional regulator [Asanoa ishikariensis]SDZ46711.1 transcriptional regulator, TetR family [Asanoa ishikariensis]